MYFLNLFERNTGAVKSGKEFFFLQKMLIFQSAMQCISNKFKNQLRQHVMLNMKQQIFLSGQISTKSCYKSAQLDSWALGRFKATFCAYQSGSDFLKNDFEFIIQYTYMDHFVSKGYTSYLLFEPELLLILPFQNTKN